MAGRPAFLGAIARRLRSTYWNGERLAARGAHLLDLHLPGFAPVWSKALRGAVALVRGERMKPATAMLADVRSLQSRAAHVLSVPYRAAWRKYVAVTLERCQKYGMEPVRVDG
jgi:hypothetical protein